MRAIRADWPSAANCEDATALVNCPCATRPVCANCPWGFAHTGPFCAHRVRQAPRRLAATAPALALALGSKKGCGPGDRVEQLCKVITPAGNLLMSDASASQTTRPSLLMR